jgi:hypothetical protein
MAALEIVEEMGNNWKQIAGRDGGHTKEKRLRHCGA